MRFLALVAPFLLLLHAPAVAQVERFELDNGLRIILRPAPRAEHTALLTLFAMGDRHDPAGRSGMAHLTEHLLVTAAAGDHPARTAEQWARAYPPPAGGCNAQTGEDYTLLATVFPAERLDQELAGLAARFSDLKITAADLERELPRLELELRNMFEGIPALAAANLARERARPSPEGFRKAGLFEQLRDVTAEEATAFHRRYYTPSNATIVIVGRFDPVALRERFTALFGAIPRGVPAPRPHPRTNAERPGEISVELTAPPWLPNPPAFIVTAAFAAPAADSQHYPAFLVQVHRLLSEAMKLHLTPNVQPFSFAPLDDPHVLYLSATADDEAGIPQARASIRRLIESATTDNGGRPRDATAAANQFLWMLGASELPGNAIHNPYGVALSLGRSQMLGIDWPDLRARIIDLTAEEMNAAARAVFAEDQAAIVTVRIRRPE